MEMDEQHLWSLPSGPAIVYLFYLLNVAPDWNRLRRLEKVSHGTKITVEDCNNHRGMAVAFRTASAEIHFAIRYTELLRIGLTPARRLLPYLLSQTIAQCSAGGRIVPGEIVIPLRDLVYHGFYSTSRSARVAVEHSMQLLRGIGLSGRVTRPQEEEQDHPEPLLSGYTIQNGTLSVRMNDKLNWAFVVQSYTVLPICCARLPARASSLLLYLSMLARQNTAKTAQGQPFSVKLQSIKIHLGLAEEQDSKSPRQEVLQPILDAIGQINQAADGMICLEPDTRPDMKAKDSLRLGRLLVWLDGNYADYFLRLDRRNRGFSRRGRLRTTAQGS